MSMRALRSKLADARPLTFQHAPDNLRCFDFKLPPFRDDYLGGDVNVHKASRRTRNRLSIEYDMAEMLGFVHDLYSTLVFYFLFERELVGDGQHCRVVNLRPGGAPGPTTFKRVPDLWQCWPSPTR